MREKVGLRRVAGVYALVERMRSAELMAASAALMEAQVALEQEAGAARLVDGSARQALEGGDGVGWSLSRAEQAAAAVRAEGLKSIENQRAGLQMEAAQAHGESRVALEQVDRAIERRREIEAVDQNRRTQAMADDRYLSRRAWLLAREPQAPAAETTARNVA